MTAKKRPRIGETEGMRGGMFEWLMTIVIVTRSTECVLTGYIACKFRFGIAGKHVK